jgi:CDP-diacylglycerol--glycerol-3-phosphate 3-phosphatidyltransferase
MTWPNWISISRVLLVIPFVLLLLRSSDDLHRRAALALFAFTAVTDFLDGWLARRYGLVTPLGELLDPLADKLLITAGSILLAIPATAVHRDGEPFVIPIEAVVLIIGKDVVVLIGFFVVHFLTGRRRFPARFPGKVSTAGQLIIVVLVLLYPELPAWTGEPIRALCYASGLLAVVACLDYVVFGAKVVAEHDRGSDLSGS